MRARTATLKFFDECGECGEEAFIRKVCERAGRVCIVSFGLISHQLSNRDAERFGQICPTFYTDANDAVFNSVNRLTI